jgi:hypothetical protein
MIQRIVLLELIPDAAGSESLREVAEHSRTVLTALPGVLSVAVGVAADGATASSWHVSLVLTFASADDLEPYRVHPDHRAYVDDYLRPRLAAIEAFNFEL